MRSLGEIVSFVVTAASSSCSEEEAKDHVLSSLSFFDNRECIGGILSSVSIPVGKEDFATGKDLAVSC